MTQKTLSSAIATKVLVPLLVMFLGAAAYGIVKTNVNETSIRFMLSHFIEFKEDTKRFQDETRKDMKEILRRTK